MKKVFYIPMVLITLNSCVMGMRNTTSTTDIVPQSHWALVQYAAATQHAKTPYVNHHCGQPSNRDARRAQGQRKKAVTPQQKALNVSQQINAYFDTNECGYNALAKIWYRFRTLSQLQSANTDILIQKLEDVDVHIKEGTQHLQELDLLAQENTYFKTLVQNVTTAYSTEKRITGSNIDSFFGYHNDLFSTLSPQLNTFIGKQITEEVITKYSHFFNYVRPPFNEKRDAFPDFDRMCISFWTSPEIHRTPLLGHECPIAEDSIQISDDNEYIKATDTSGTTIIWKTLTGNPCDADEAKDCKWIKKELFELRHEEYPQQVGFFGNNQYHVSFSYTDSDTIPTLYLYVKPTFMSWLSQTALFNNLGNNSELDELSQSRIIRHGLTGFPKNNLKNEIKKAQNRLARTNIK